MSSSRRKFPEALLNCVLRTAHSPVLMVLDSGAVKVRHLERAHRTAVH